MTHLRAVILQFTNTIIIIKWTHLSRPHKAGLSNIHTSICTYVRPNIAPKLYQFFRFFSRHIFDITDF